MTDLENQTNPSPPEEFYKLINDFIADILITFPEYKGFISKWWNKPAHNGNIEVRRNLETLFVYKHCLKVYPENFVNILYKKEEIFDLESDAITEFLPGLVFKQLWNCDDISDNTRETIWKYLQLILFSVIGNITGSDKTQDNSKIFENVNEEELKNKLQETLNGMQHLFGNVNNDSNDPETGTIPDVDTNTNFDSMPESFKMLLDGKIGKLAMELAEETANDLNLDFIY